jgi:myo-inositol 2-dehydrogenase / D-chiro-inositol 1-dehydrogenase
VQDALEVAFIAEAATLSLQEHRPVRVAEVTPDVRRLV